MHKRRRKEDTLVFTQHNGPARERNRDTGHSREPQSGTRKLGGHEGIFWVLEMPWNLTWVLVTQLFYLIQHTRICAFYLYRHYLNKILWRNPPKLPEPWGSWGEQGQLEFWQTSLRYHWCFRGDSQIVQHKGEPQGPLPQIYRSGHSQPN